jgi:GNAT superfamily N-acetyltransferase
MSLYTLSTSDHLPALDMLPGLHFEESTDLTLLSQMGEVTEGEVVKRLANSNTAFIAFYRGQPAAFGWMASGRCRIGELAHEFMLPAGNRYLWNFRTMAAFRGRGIYPLLLQFILQYERSRANRFWIIHAPENKSSLKGIGKAGFRYLGKLYSRADGHAGIETISISREEVSLIDAMHFKRSAQPAATCWNCSSPYLKNKRATCCCTDAGETCSAPASERRF